jgi:multidrug efflux pump subunit AcrA (membrane-fusion protein)
MIKTGQVESRVTALLAICLATAACTGSRAASPPEPVAPKPQIVEASKPAQTPRPRLLRTLGTIAAQRALSIQVPRISGQGGGLTLVQLIPNGSVVHKGDLLAEFDGTAQVKTQRDAQAKYDDLSHQVEQKIAESHSNAAKRQSDLSQAMADLDKAKLEIRKGPVLSDLDQLKNAEKLRDAEAHVKSLLNSNKLHDDAERAEIEVLVLQRDRQKVTLARLKNDFDKLTIHATLDGMIALDTIWKNNSMGHAKEGDQLYPGNPLLRIFDPSTMVLQLSVNEADGAALRPGSKAMVHLDAYPSLVFTAHFDSASPVAASALGSPLKTFAARYIIDSKDPHLLPDLSVAADILPPESGAQ